MTSLSVKSLVDLAELTDPLFQEGQSDLVSTWSPAVDVYEDEDYLNIVADLPGVDPKSIAIKVKGDLLWFGGERKLSYGGNTKFFSAERAGGPFLRTVLLPADVNTEEVKAHCENGVLSITLPKKAEAKPRKIVIEG